MIVEAIEQDAGQDLHGNGEQGDAAVVITDVSVPFTLVEVDYGSVFKLLWQSFLRPQRVEQAGEGLDQYKGTLSITMTKGIILSYVIR